ncbi:PREDICTED: LOW QUALITY PROTEIN: carboxypeptidase Q-like [Priapulus caudatus]|uniref:Carboxypeptidase Q n=1 Tax=Priapulus caudatus TaxID=37621 RepID=A0ABM1EIG8_PRICU|nr:PREDICTED: LOW QUALITY PROTEIN: carboxypeptidase Q-like [Priapulus caudatus]
MAHTTKMASPTVGKHLRKIPVSSAMISVNSLLAFSFLLFHHCYGFAVNNGTAVTSKILAEDHAKKIIQHILHGNGKHQTYNRLAHFVDKFGYRITGSDNLENSIDYMLHHLQSEGLDNVHGESVWVRPWVRGEESAHMLEPRLQKLSLLGLGSSIRTPPEGITAEVIVVKSFEELRNRSEEAKGKIVVYNEEWVTYGTSVQYRTRGATEAAKVAAVASLVRSVTPFSIYSPHTGHQSYDANVKKIPTACITVEDVAMLQRMAERGEKIVINLKMSAKYKRPRRSRNVVAEIVGHKFPEEVVLVSGHLDSWDVGQGAMDDGGGAFISWEVLTVLKKLKLRPKRTIRLVLWTGEEEGIIGGQEYFRRHHSNISNFDMVMESDSGVFTPNAVSFQGNKVATAIMKRIVRPLKPLNVSMITGDFDGPDIDVWADAGVPAVALRTTDPEKYFWFHHSNGDTMSVLNPMLSICVLLFGQS